MNDTHALNKELITQVLQEILAEKPALFASSACQCHWIDPHKLRMLLWEDQGTYILKIAEQKFVGESRRDRRGQVYWRFRELYESKEAKASEAPVPAKKPLSMYSKDEIDRLVKFPERQAQAPLASDQVNHVNSEQPATN